MLEDETDYDEEDIGDDANFLRLPLPEGYALRPRPAREQWGNTPYQLGMQVFLSHDLVMAFEGGYYAGELTAEEWQEFEDADADPALDIRMRLVVCEFLYRRGRRTELDLLWKTLGSDNEAARVVVYDCLRLHFKRVDYYPIQQRIKRDDLPAGFFDRLLADVASENRSLRASAIQLACLMDYAEAVELAFAQEGVEKLLSWQLVNLSSQRQRYWLAQLAGPQLFAENPYNRLELLQRLCQYGADDVRPHAGPILEEALARMDAKTLAQWFRHLHSIAHNGDLSFLADWAERGFRASEDAKTRESCLTALTKWRPALAFELALADLREGVTSFAHGSALKEGLTPDNRAEVETVLRATAVQDIYRWNYLRDLVAEIFPPEEWSLFVKLDQMGNFGVLRRWHNDGFTAVDVLRDLGKLGLIEQRDDAQLAAFRAEYDRHDDVEALFEVLFWKDIPGVVSLSTDTDEIPVDYKDHLWKWIDLTCGELAPDSLAQLNPECVFELARGSGHEPQIPDAWRHSGFQEIYGIELVFGQELYRFNVNYMGDYFDLRVQIGLNECLRAQGVAKRFMYSFQGLHLVFYGHPESLEAIRLKYGLELDGEWETRTFAPALLAQQVALI